MLFISPLSGFKFVASVSSILGKCIKYSYIYPPAGPLEDVMCWLSVPALWDLVRNPEKQLSQDWSPSQDSPLVPSIHCREEDPGKMGGVGGDRGMGLGWWGGGTWAGCFIRFKKHKMVLKKTMRNIFKLTESALQYHEKKNEKWTNKSEKRRQMTEWQVWHEGRKSQLRHVLQYFQATWLPRSGNQVRLLPGCYEVMSWLAGSELAAPQYSPAEFGVRGNGLAGEGHGAHLTLTGTRVL